jgi:hypothetical protein
MNVIPRRLAGDPLGAPQGGVMTLRQTKFMDKTAERDADLALELTQHPQIATHFYYFAAALAEHLDLCDHPLYQRVRNLDPQWEALGPEPLARLDALCFRLLDRIKEHLPRLHRVCADNPLLPQQAAFAILGKEATDDDMRERLFQLARRAVPQPVTIGTPLPDNPIRITENRATGGLRYEVPEGKRATRAHWLEIANIENARLPARSRGRPPKKSADKPAKPNVRTLDPELAALAYRMDQAGKSRKEIVGACFQHLTPAERRTDKVRKRIERLIECGGLNPSRSKKPGRNK